MYNIGREGQLPPKEETVMSESTSYTVYTVPDRTGRLVLVTDIHNCHANWHAPTPQRLETLVEALCHEHGRRPYDAILALGDYSLDFWLWNEGGSYLWDPPVSNTEGFVREYVPRLPAEIFMIPGNHEQYGEGSWRRITGRPREFALVYGERVFLMLDTFGGGLDPTENHDGVYTGIRTELLSAVLTDYPDREIILCAHDLIPELESEAARRLILENPRILCAFTGHTHRDNVRLLPAAWRHLPVFYCGDFSYTCKQGKEKNWGYRLLETAGEGISTEYVPV